MKKTDSIQKGLVLTTLVLLTLAAPIQAMVSAPAVLHQHQATPMAPLDPPTLVWEDLFDNATKIDPTPPGSGRTDNYTVTSGHASMVGTIPAWTDSSFTRMKPYTLTNTGAAKTNYVLKITVAYDSDMQSTFNDLRFRHSSDPTNWLQYWIEFKNTTVAIVWVKILNVPTSTSTLYMFYGNPTAPSVSNFANTIGNTWSKTWASDQQISNQPGSQYAVDPDIAFGNNKFLSAWEEGTTGPLWYRGIEGQIRDINGSVVVSTFVIKEKPGGTYRYENPSAVYGGTNFIVAYSNYTTPIDPASQDLEAEIVRQNGTIAARMYVCTQSERQQDPNVIFDSNLNRFTVIWTDARLGTTNYNLYARQYNTTGGAVGTEKTIVSTTSCQTMPWITYDHVHSRNLVVWEDSTDPVNGPFSIYAQLFDSSLTAIGSSWIVATGTSSTDNVWPSASYSDVTQRYLISWNTADISSTVYYGNVLAHMYDWQGTSVGVQTTIASGSYHDTTVEPFLTASFLVTYNSASAYDARLIGPSLELVAAQFQFTSASAVNPNTPSTAVGGKKIFAGWEDNRLSSTYTYVYANINTMTNLPTDTDVSNAVGTEQPLILTAHVTSVAITPAVLNYWSTFNAILSGNVTFSILDGSTGTVLLASISPGGSLASITATSIRLKATLSRPNPSTSPYLDKWNVSWVTNHPPNIPTSPSPSNQSTFNNPVLLLGWIGTDPDGDTVTHDVYFGATTTPPKVAANLSTASYDPGTLLYQTTYYWRITTWDPYGYFTAGPLWHFTTDAYPYTPTTPNPANHTGGVETTANISWTCTDPDAGDTLVYDVYLGTTNPPALVSVHQYDTTYSPGILSYLQNYYWRIVAIDIYGATTTGPLWNFTTVYAPNNPPYAPTNPNPANGSINISNNADLSWTGGDPDIVDTVTYDVYFGTSSPPPLVATSQPTATYDPGNMDYLTTYYWQIISWDNRGASTTGPIWHFTTMDEVNYPPYLPSDPNPGNHATAVNINADLSWTCGDPNQGDTLTYDVYFGTSSTPPLIVHNQTATTYNPGEMEYLTKYYWKIVAWDNHHASTQGNTWDFTTEQEINYPPNIPSNPSPANGTTDVQTTPTLSWTGGDPNPHDTVTYDVYFGNTSSPPLVANNQTATVYITGHLDYNTTYYWQIVAWDNHGVSTPGPAWKFTVMPQPPDITPPTVTLVKPLKALYIKNVKVMNFFTTVAIGFLDVEVNATDNETGVAKVVFSLDGVPKSTTSFPPYVWRWAEAGFFFYQLTVTAYDYAGNKQDVSLRVWKFL
jgi:hypothetical protein